MTDPRWIRHETQGSGHCRMEMKYVVEIVPGPTILDQECLGDFHGVLFLSNGLVMLQASSSIGAICG